MKNILPGHHGYELIEVDAPVHLLVLLTVLDHGLQFLLGGTETVLSQNLQFRTLMLLTPSHNCKQGWMKLLLRFLIQFRILHYCVFCSNRILLYFPMCVC